MFRIIVVVGSLLVGHLGVCFAEDRVLMTGGTSTYTVVPKDYLGKIGARFGVSTTVLAKSNGIDDLNHIRPGQKLLVNNLHIVPEHREQAVVINVPQRMLYLFKEQKLVDVFPVGLGKPNWPTYLGTTRVAQLRKNPVWFVPASIQAEMERERQTVVTRVEPGADNPLGAFWIGLGAPGYGIHGTIAPDSIYNFQSHGCIRLHPDDIAELFPQVDVGLGVELIYEPVLLVVNQGRVYIEVHSDIYKLGHDARKDLERLAAEQSVTDKIDWQRVGLAIEAKDGLAHDVTLGDSKQAMR